MPVEDSRETGLERPYPCREFGSAPLESARTERKYRGLLGKLVGIVLDAFFRRSVEKHGRQFRLPADNFVGEVAYVLNRKTTTTSVAPQGVRYVEWDADALRALSAKHPDLGNALNALLTRDLAKKLNASYRPDDAMPATEESVELLATVEA